MDREDMTRERSESLLLPARHRFEPYPAYQDSGVQWLGEIPAHWEVQRTKHVARLRSGHTPSRQHPEYWVDCTIRWFGLADVWQLRDGRQEYVAETNEKISALGPANSAARLLPKGTVILSRTASVGFSGIMATEMATTQDFVNWVCGESIRPEYLLYVFRSMTHEFRRLTMGSTHQTIYMPDVGKFSTPVPPILEQEGIVAFIRKETARIDGLMAKKERLIELLQEKRAALITRAVTKGLDPTVPMKDSGVEWLGQIPASWSLARLKRLVTRVEQGWSPLCENRQADDHEWGVLKVGCVNGIEFDGTENKALPPDLDPLEDFEIAPGDILMSRANTRQLLGNAALVRIVRPRLLLCDKLYRIRVRSQLVLPSFLVHAFSSSLSRFQFEREATGASASMQNISQQMILELLVPCPPPEEQERIVEVVERDTAQLSGLIERTGGAVAHLQELRAALISAAVTGKIDVRAA